MIDPQIRMRHIRCFLETARLGSLSAAADAAAHAEYWNIIGCLQMRRKMRRHVFD